MRMYLRLSLILIMFLLCGPISSVQAQPQFPGPETDTGSYILVSVFDLRDRESFVQVTNTSGAPVTTHVQIFTVNDNCRENNFFDSYTGNDTHVYNMRDIQTNVGSPSGVVLNDGDYGMVVVTVNTGGVIDDTLLYLIGNFRIVDDAGYEYRTNSSAFTATPLSVPSIVSANFSTEGGITQGDIFIVTLSDTEGGSPEVSADPVQTYFVFDFDIFNNAEVPFSCSNFIAACIDQDNPRLEELLAAAVGGASLATFEAGLNDALPSSKGAPSVCPGNVVSEGLTRSTIIGSSFTGTPLFAAFVGLNNGAGRGSMDQVWLENLLLVPPTP